MTKKRLLIVGCGDLGLRLARSLRPALWQVSGSRRQPPEAETSIDWIQADHCEPGALDVIAKLQPDYVLATFTPTDRDVPGYRQGFGFAAKNLTQALAGQPVSRIIMASSTRVYAERKGGWVDETSPLATDDERGSAIIDAEACFLNSTIPTTVVRFGGIYGATNSRLLARIESGRVAPATPVRYTNRIHRDDCAGFLAHLLVMDANGNPPLDVYNGVDDCPAPAYEVESWLASTIGKLSTHSHTPAGIAGHKRCRNSRLHDCGYRLTHPDFRSGYTQLLEQSDRPEVQG